MCLASRGQDYEDTALLPPGRLSTTPMQRPRAITVPPSEPMTVFAVVAVAMVYDS